MDDVGADPGGESTVDVLLPKPFDSFALQFTVEQLWAVAASKEAQRTLSSPRGRRTVRRTELTIAERRWNTHYQDLCERIDVLEHELDGPLERIDDPRPLEALKV
jgi:hypothetical protein